MKGLVARGSLTRWCHPTVIPPRGTQAGGWLCPVPQEGLISLAFPVSPRLCSFSFLGLGEQWRGGAHSSQELCQWHRDTREEAHRPAQSFHGWGDGLGVPIPATPEA